jgi:hypothetical protein
MELGICVLPCDLMLRCTIWGGCYIIALVGTSVLILINSPSSHAEGTEGQSGHEDFLLDISITYAA